MEQRKGDWIQTYTGKPFWPLDPRVEDIDILDIAHALSNICRFTGHCTSFYSVAQHSVYVSELCHPTVALYGLLHDAAEAYMCDLARPVKHLPELKPYREAEDWLENIILDKFGLPCGLPPEIHDADNIMLTIEVSSIMAKPKADWKKDWLKTVPDDCKIKSIENCWLPQEAKARFLNRFYALTIPTSMASAN